MNEHENYTRTKTLTCIILTVIFLLLVCVDISHAADKKDLKEFCSPEIEGEAICYLVIKSSLSLDNAGMIIAERYTYFTSDTVGEYALNGMKIDCESNQILITSVNGEVAEAETYEDTHGLGESEMTDWICSRTNLPRK